jgi:membrane-associated phospholipid phosphatase
MLHRQLPGIVLWVIGVLVLVVLCFMVRLHPASWPFELQFAKLIQGPHPVPCIYRSQSHSWIDIASDYTNRFNDPFPSVVVPLLVMAALALFRLFWEALFLGIITLAASSLWGGIELLVARPRATPADGICIHRVIAAYSFPSGHVMHDVGFYGFLLYLSFTKPVRQWRYHWILYPLQIIVVLYLLAVGYARVEAGEHHLLDVLGGYLASVLCLFFFIFLYRLVTVWWATHHRKKIAEVS